MKSCSSAKLVFPIQQNLGFYSTYFLLSIPWLEPRLICIRKDLWEATEIVNINSIFKQGAPIVHCPQETTLHPHQHPINSVLQNFNKSSTLDKHLRNPIFLIINALKLYFKSTYLFSGHLWLINPKFINPSS